MQIIAIDEDNLQSNIAVIQLYYLLMTNDSLNYILTVSKQYLIQIYLV